MLSGLKGIFEDEVEIPENEELIERYFPEMALLKTKRRGIKREQLRGAFLMYTPRKHKVQLAIAFLVECLVCGNVERRLIDMDTMCLMTDLDAFNQYSWGKKAFGCLYQFIMDFKEWTLRKLVYQIGCFFHVLQVFALEVFPRLAELCATKDLT